MYDLNQRIIDIDEDVQHLTVATEYIQAQIMQLLKEKEDAIHDLKVEARNKTVWFEVPKKKKKEKVVDHTQDPNNTYGLIM